MALDSKQARATRLKSARMGAGLSRKAMAELSGDLRPSTLQSWETPREAPKPNLGGLTKKGANRVIHALYKAGVRDCTFNWLYHGIGEGPKIGLGFGTFSESAGNTIPNVPVKQDEAIVRELLLFRKHCSNAMDHFISDDGMAPHYNKGDCLAGKRVVSEKDITNLVGSDCIVETHENEILLRRLLKGSQAGLFNLACTNLETSVSRIVMYNQRIISAASVAWHRRKTCEN